MADPDCNNINHLGNIRNRANMVGSGTTQQTCATKNEPTAPNAKFEWFDTNGFYPDSVKKAEAAKIERDKAAKIKIERDKAAKIERDKAEKIKRDNEKKIELKPKYEALQNMIEEYKSDITNSIIETYNKNETITLDDINITEDHFSQLKTAFDEVSLFYKDDLLKWIENAGTKGSLALLKDKFSVSSVSFLPLYVGYSFIIIGLDEKKKIYKLPSSIYRHILYCKLLGKFCDPSYLKPILNELDEYNNIIIKGRELYASFEEAAKKAHNTENLLSLYSILVMSLNNRPINKDNYEYTIFCINGTMITLGRIDYIKITEGDLIESQFTNGDNVYKVTTNKFERTLVYSEKDKNTYSCIANSINWKIKEKTGALGLWGGKTKRKRCKKGSRRNKRTNRCKKTNTNRKR
uniref:Uncharacterized protein n=1 Tax=viral metagenome TaxID=1070528 RepID=A0A6C0I484_9ZZZZ